MVYNEEGSTKSWLQTIQVKADNSSKRATFIILINSNITFKGLSLNFQLSPTYAIALKAQLLDYQHNTRFITTLVIKCQIPCLSLIYFTFSTKAYVNIIVLQPVCYVSGSPNFLFLALQFTEVGRG